MEWMKAAGGTCTAFDMTTKGILHQAFEVRPHLTPLQRAHWSAQPASRSDHLDLWNQTCSAVPTGKSSAGSVRPLGPVGCRRCTRLVCQQHPFVCQQHPVRLCYGII